MSRNNPKPGGKVNWDATGNIVEPNAGRKTSGWLFTVKPPAENFNWLWNLLGLNQFYSNAQVQDWIVIDSDADEGDYATLTAYLADAPAAGDRVLVKEDQTVTVQTVIPSEITLKFLDGSRLLSSTNIATSVLQLGSDIVIEGVLNIVLSQAGVTGKAVEFNGDNVTGKINVENASTGTLTTAYNLNASKTGNKVDGFAQNTGGGTLTNVLLDNSTEDSNNIIIVDEPNNKLTRSRGAFKFRDGFEFDLGSDAVGDIYYRDAGILKRLPKGTDGQVLELASGVPAWSRSGRDSIRDIARDLIIRTNLGSPNSNVDIDADEVMLQNSSGISRAFSSINLTVDITANGDSNGLDTLPGVSEAVDTWYYIFIIAKEDGTVQGLLSTSSTAPTMPSGYTFASLVGAVRNNGSSNFIIFEQRGNRVDIEEQVIIKNGSFSTSAWIAQSITSFYPPTAKKISAAMGSNTRRMALSPRSDGFGGQYSYHGDTGLSGNFGGVFPTDRQNYVSFEIRYEDSIYYFIGSSNGTLLAMGWEY